MTYFKRMSWFRDPIRFTFSVMVSVLRFFIGGRDLRICDVSSMFATGTNGVRRRGKKCSKGEKRHELRDVAQRNDTSKCPPRTSETVNYPKVIQVFCGCKPLLEGTVTKMIGEESC